MPFLDVENEARGPPTNGDSGSGSGSGSDREAMSSKKEISQG